MSISNESSEVVTFEDSFGEATGKPIVPVDPVVRIETPVDVKPIEEKVVEVKPTDGVDTPGTNDDYKTLYEKEVQRVKSWEGRLSAAERRANEAQVKLKELETKAPDTAGIKPGSLIDAEDPLIQSFIKEMGDDFIKPLDAYLKRQINEALKPFAGIADKMPVIEKQVSTIDENRVQDHYAQILESHNDVTEILESGELETWVDTLPYKDAVTAKQTMQTGTTKQVINLLTEFKEKTGKVKKEEPLIEKPNLTVVPKVPKEKLDAATAVKGGSYIVPKGKAAADDFEGAFKEAISN